MSSTNNIVYRSWEQLLEQKFNLFQSILQNRDKELMAAVNAHDRLSPVDWPATFRSHAQAQKPSSSSKKDNVLRVLKERLLETNKQIRVDTNEILDSMKNLAHNKKATKLDWIRVLDKAENLMDEKARGQLELLKKLGLNMIRGLDSEKDQAEVRWVFEQSGATIVSYCNSVLWFIGVAKDSAGDWYEDPWHNVKLFTKAAGKWGDIAETLILKIFDGYFRRDQNGADSFASIHALNKGPSTLEDRDEVLRSLKDVLLKTNKLIRQDTVEISNSFEELAHKGGSEQQWVQVLNDGEDLMKNKALDQMTEMKQFAIDKINSLDAKDRDEVGEIFGRACTALTGFHGSVMLFINVARGSAHQWYQDPRDNTKIFRVSIKNWYDGADDGINRAFLNNLRRGNRKGENSLSSMQDIATKLQGMGVDNITIVPKSDGWALNIGAPM